MSKQTSIYQEEFQKKYASLSHISRSLGSLFAEIYFKRFNIADNYDLIVAGSGFASNFTTLIFLESQEDGKNARVALIGVGKKGERCMASRTGRWHTRG